jgi:hypothetical protein
MFHELSPAAQGPMAVDGDAKHPPTEGGRMTGEIATDLHGFPSYHTLATPALYGQPAIGGREPDVTARSRPGIPQGDQVEPYQLGEYSASHAGS